jgi:hypothetical protein
MAEEARAGAGGRGPTAGGAWWPGLARMAAAVHGRRADGACLGTRGGIGLVPGLDSPGSCCGIWAVVLCHARAAIALGLPCWRPAAARHGCVASRRGLRARSLSVSSLTRTPFLDSDATGFARAANPGRVARRRRFFRRRARCLGCSGDGPVPAAAGPMWADDARPLGRAE